MVGFALGRGSEPVAGRRAVFLDIDGTIATEAGEMAASTPEAVRLARGAGHLVFLSTGRSAVEVPEWIVAIGFDGVVAAGGGFGYVHGRLVFQRTMPPSAARRMVQYYVENDIEYYLQYERRVFASPSLERRFREALDPSRTRLPLPFVAEGVLSYEGVAKSVFVGSGLGTFDRVYRSMCSEFAVVTGTIPHLGTGSGEVAPFGMNKGTSIEILLEHLGMPREAAVAVGDNFNDVEMLRYCGVGIAMGNAPESVRRSADWVTTSVLDDGIWNAFARVGLLP